MGGRVLYIEFNMKVVVTGARSFLAASLIPELVAHQWTLVLTSHNADVTVAGLPIHPLDLSHAAAIDALVAAERPEWIVNCAAISLPDWAEDHRPETVAANVTAVQNLVDSCSKYRCKLLHMSTDYVFDGVHAPFREDSPRAPVNFYGQTKFDAEKILERSSIHWLICRTTVLYGWKEPYHRPNILEDWWPKLAADQPIDAPTEHITNPTYVGDLAKALVHLMDHDAQGIYHTAGSQSMSRYEVALALAHAMGKPSTLVKAAKVIPKRAVRPHNTTLSVEKLKREWGLVLRAPTEVFPELLQSHRKN